MESNSIGEKIARARKKMNLSQAQLAVKLFISPQAVGKWERGESIPDIVTMNKLAKILEVDLNYFSEDTLRGEPASPVSIGESADDKIHSSSAGSPNGPRELLTNFSGSALSGTDFSGVVAHKRKFHGSALQGSDFSNADLTGSSFKASDAAKSRFISTNLTDCTFHAVNLSGVSFEKAVLVRTEFSASDLNGTRFTKATIRDAKFMAMDLTRALFQDCTFTGVDFKSSDLSGLSFEGQSFTDVKFDDAALKGASFKGAALTNVSFRPTFALTNRYYRAIKNICFDDAVMDKLTYAALKAIGANLSGVVIR